VGGASLIGGAMSAKGARDAAGAAAAGADAATAEQRRQYDLSRQDQMPWLLAGNSALAQLQALNRGDFSSFKESPDYAYARDQMQQGLERGAAARGGLYSGGTSVDLANALNGIANQNYGSYYNRIASLAGIGQTTASNLGQLGQAAATNIGNAQMAAGNARASGYTGRANAWNSALGGMAGAYAWGQGNNWGRAV